MNRWCVLAAGLFAATATAFISGASRPPEDEDKPAEEKKPEAQPLRIVAQRTAYFNMAAVMRESQQVKYQLWKLHDKKNELSKNLIVWRQEYIKLHQEMQSNRPGPQPEVAEKMLRLAVKIVEEEREIDKQLHPAANAVISDLYDKIYVVVEKVAKLNGYQAVLTYPDGVTPEELNDPHIKKLKLKPEALQPFEIDPRFEITAVVVKTLNAWYPPTDPKTGRPVDVSGFTVPLQPSANTFTTLSLPPGAIPLLGFERPPDEAPTPPPSVPPFWLRGGTLRPGEPPTPPARPTTPPVKLPPIPVPSGPARPPSEPPSEFLPPIPVAPIPMKR